MGRPARRQQCRALRPTYPPAAHLQHLGRQPLRLNGRSPLLGRRPLRLVIPVGPAVRALAPAAAAAAAALEAPPPQPASGGELADALHQRVGGHAGQLGAHDVAPVQDAPHQQLRRQNDAGVAPDARGRRRRDPADHRMVLHCGVVGARAAASEGGLRKGTRAGA
jgi:hypothetical protein